MKRLTVFTTILFAIFLYRSGAWANIIWMPTESGEIDVQYLDYMAPHDFAIFDDSSSLIDSEPHLMINNTPSYPGFPFAGDTIEFTQVGSDWLLTSDKTGNTLTLTNSYYFQVAMRDITGTWYPVDAIMEQSYGQYVLQWMMDPRNPKDDVFLLQVDARPVPVPPSIILLGFGLTGLALGRRRRTRQK